MFFSNMRLDHYDSTQVYNVNACQVFEQTQELRYSDQEKLNNWQNLLLTFRSVVTWSFAQRDFVWLIKSILSACAAQSPWLLVVIVCSILSEKGFQFRCLAAESLNNWQVHILSEGSPWELASSVEKSKTSRKFGHINLASSKLIRLRLILQLNGWNKIFSQASSSSSRQLMMISEALLTCR